MSEVEKEWENTGKNKLKLKNNSAELLIQYEKITPNTQSSVLEVTLPFGRGMVRAE